MSELVSNLIFRSSSHATDMELNVVAMFREEHLMDNHLRSCKVSSVTLIHKLSPK